MGDQVDFDASPVPKGYCQVGDQVSFDASPGPHGYCQVGDHVGIEASPGPGPAPSNSGAHSWLSS